MGQARHGSATTTHAVIRGEGESATHRAHALMAEGRFDAKLIHTHTFDMEDLPEALRYVRQRVEDAIKVVVKNSH